MEIDLAAPLTGIDLPAAARLARERGPARR